MYKLKQKTGRQSSCFNLADTLNPNHFLYILFHKMDWNMPDEILKRHERLTGKPAKTFVHLKSGHKLEKNFYKGIRGDRINVLLRAAAFNFKRMMNEWKKTFLPFFIRIFQFLIANNEKNFNPYVVLNKMKSDFLRDDY